MKKKILLASFVLLGFLGITTAIRALTLPLVSSGVAQTITLPTNSVTLTGTASSVNGPITTYAWTEVSGGTANIVTPSISTTLVNNLVQGSYTFRLTATDSTNASASSDVVITVNPDPTKPVVSAGSTQTIILPVSTVTLTGSATASTGRTISSYSWVQKSGPVSSSIVTPTSATTVVNGLTTTGTYVFTLTATDSTNLSNSADVSVVVSPALSGPSVNAGNTQTIVVPTSTVTLNGSATAASGRTITSYSWIQTSGPVSSSIVTPTSATTVVNGLTNVGNYIFTLTATDNSGATGNANVTIRVNNQPTPNPSKTKMQLTVGPNGNANLSGVLLSNSGGVLTVKVWGIVFTVNTANVANISSTLSDITKFVIGDTVKITGVIDPNASNPTINARTVKDQSVHISTTYSDKGDNGKHLGLLKALTNLGGDNKIGNGHDGKGDN